MYRIRYANSERPILLRTTKSVKQKQETSIHTGSSFDDFLDEANLRSDVERAAIKKMLARQFEQEMLKQQKPPRENPQP